MEEKNAMYKVSEFIVSKRKLIYILYAAAIVFSIIGMNYVEVNNSLTSYLPSNTETKRGIDIMDEEFVTYASTNVMVSNITYKQAEKIEKIIEESDGVKSVTFDNDEEHYKSSAALFEVTLTEDEDLDRELEIVDRIKAKLAAYDSYFYSDSIDDSSKTLDKEMSIIMILAVAVILVVLLFTSQSFMEVPIFCAVLGGGVLLNMGTNFFMGEISFITKSVAAVLQLALGLDYSIILANRFAEEKQEHDEFTAIVNALSKGIVEISSSSLTTIAGLAALLLMQLKIGYDLGTVLCKGIIFCLVSVFLLMPGLLYDASGLIDKTTHKNYVPSIKGFCELIVKARWVLPFVFAVVVVACAVISSMCPYSFDTVTDKPTRPTEKSIARDKIEALFGEKHTLALVVPKGDYDSERKILDAVEDFDYVSSARGLANTEVDDGITLTEKITPRQVANLMDMDYDLCKLLYQAYGADNEEYGALVGDVSQYRISLIDLFPFIHDYMDKGVITLSQEDEDDLNDTYDDLMDAEDQLEGKKYARLIFTYSCSIESDEAYELIEKVRAEGEKYYDDVLTVSNTTSCGDMKDSFTSDNKKISLFTFLSVLIILIFTFKSWGLSILLVMSIQGSVWINFSIPYIINVPLIFIGYLVVSSIQMGATIDYAIVVSNRYLQLRAEGMTPIEAASTALDQAFPTILTSGSILTIAGYILSYVSTNSMIATLGSVLGRGTLTSITIVMLVIPNLLILLDKFIAKTTLKPKEKPENKRKLSIGGVIAVNGKIDGYVNGYIRGEFKGVVKGEMNAKVDIGAEAEIDDGEETKLLEENKDD